MAAAVDELRLTSWGCYSKWFRHPFVHMYAFRNYLGNGITLNTKVVVIDGSVLNKLFEALLVCVVGVPARARAQRLPRLAAPRRAGASRYSKRTRAAHKCHCKAPLNLWRDQGRSTGGLPKNAGTPE